MKKLLSIILTKKALAVIAALTLSTTAITTIAVVASKMHNTEVKQLKLQDHFDVDLYIQDHKDLNEQKVLNEFVNQDFNSKKIKELGLKSSDFKVVKNEKENVKNNWIVQLKSNKYKVLDNLKLDIIDSKTYEALQQKVNKIFKAQEDGFGTFHTQQEVLDQLLVYLKDEKISGLKTLRLTDSTNADKNLIKGNKTNILKFKFYNQNFEFKLNQVLEDEVETKYDKDDQNKVTQIGYKVDKSKSSSGLVILTITDRNKQIKEVPKHLPLEITSLKNAFADLQSSSIINLDIWNTSNIKSFFSAFSRTKNFDQNLNNWDTSNVVNMSSMFAEAKSFNQSLKNWNTSKVTDMNNMFYDAYEFNGDISNWDTKNVKNMQGMFSGAKSFDKDLNFWRTKQVTDMGQMFWGASAFNGNISTWNTENVTDMNQMFADAEKFNQDISGWNTSNVTNMYGMFSGAQSFRYSLKRWNVQKVNDVKSFRGRGATNSFFTKDTLPNFKSNVLKDIDK
ncbi:Hypothetical protein, DUF285 family [Mycoplasma yeatsii 13926]|uniref:PARCEL domain-containing protein n=1 Tax=Mycoplasma yeatsii 13926 TaxID=1188240 RepID=S6G3T4_9MOLU|nr:BspA family leucine-rich repeat surface protein [Mycoplasma yeatsii]EOA07521.1 Hypothetical protein, DUF285 family [Mycoplasma yeatsii 13926]